VIVLKNQAITADSCVAGRRHRAENLDQGKTPRRNRGALVKKVKLAVKPGSVVDSHSSGPHITARLKPPTRKLGGTRQRLPIRCCSGWRLPRFTPLPGQERKHVAALTTHPTSGLVSVALFLASRRTGVTRHPTLWSPDFPLCAARTSCLVRFVPRTAAAWPASLRILSCGHPATRCNYAHQHASRARTAASKSCKWRSCTPSASRWLRVFSR